jgi:dTDP-4-dehydrorhamnose reductase
LRWALAPLGEVVALTRAECDLRAPAELRAIVRAHRPDLVVNAAAYTAVDAAESESELAMDVNGHAPGVLAEEARALGAPIVHFSTDYVFDGRKSGPYREDDAPNPLNAYGRSKLAGEAAVAAAGGTHVVLRVAWIYGRRGRNFLLTMLRLARERDELRVVDDQVGGPTWSGALAAVTAALCAGGAGRIAERPGVYHCSAPDHTSWHGLAVALLAADPLRREQRCRSVVAIPSTAFPTAARRPANSRLDAGLLGEAYGLRLPPWREQLAACLADERPAIVRG